MNRSMGFLLYLILLTGLLGTGEAAAQFEGVIDFRSWEPGKTDAAERSLRVYATQNRFLLESGESYRAFSGMNANGFLVRNDRNDFVFFSGEDPVALRIEKGDVDNISRMASYLQGNQKSETGFDWSGRIDVTGETRRIHGYETEEIRVYEEASDNHMIVWLTRGIKINWGILQEMWHQNLASMANTDLPIELFMNRNSFPLRIEYYVEGRQTTLVEAVDIRTGPVDPRKLEIPEGTELIGITDLVMRMMRERR